MKKKNRSEAVSTFIGSDARIEGTIAFDGTIRIDGRVTGRICSAGGTLIVGEQAVVNAEIEVDAAIIMGEVNGTIEASDRIEAYPPCRMSGDIQAPVISIEPGVVFNGTCAMKAANVTSFRPQEGERQKDLSEGE
ncbi:MAG: polymer-forming cytoskeletal protein [Desulfobacterales bacterium]|nr:polymer-forming cytoskeletal protein [Desulfobacterales bacterium]